MEPQWKAKWRWRLLRWGLISLATLATLIAALITEENWRGKHDLDAYRRQKAAEGDLVDQYPGYTNTIPDDQNFAKAPIVLNLDMQDTRADGSAPENANGNWERSRLTDLAAWQRYYRTAPTHSPDQFPIATKPQSAAAEVLFALSKYDSEIEQLRLASQRPYSRFADDGWNGSMNFSDVSRYFNGIKLSCLVLRLRAIAELANNQSGHALEDVTLLLRLTDLVRQEPTLLAHLVSISMARMAIEVIYEGLAQHHWSEKQLAQLEKEIGEEDFLADYQKAMRGERAFAIHSLEYMRQTREHRLGTNQPALFWLTPDAVFYQNELACTEICDEDCLPLVDLQKRIVSPTAARQTSAKVVAETQHSSPYRLLATMSSSTIIRSVERFAIAQSEADLAQIACALERYRLANGNYPQKLHDLLPQFIAKLPHDVIDGQPLRYHLTQDGQFILYSVGWNEKDDGGKVELRKNGSVDPEKGDWVWRYPGK